MDKLSTDCASRRIAPQIGWVEKQHGIADYAGAMLAWTQKSGRGFGAAYAEGFRQYTGTLSKNEAVAGIGGGGVDGGAATKIIVIPG